MKFKLFLGLPIALTLGLLLAGCDNNSAPKAPAATTQATTDQAAADKAAADKAAADKAAADKAAADKAAADKAAADKAAADKAAADKAAADKAAADKAAADRAAADKAAADKAAADKAAADAAATAAPATNSMMAASEAVLPASGLKADTTLAAKASDASKPYLGVWANDAAGCASVDQAGAKDYAVINKLSIRMGDQVCLGEGTAIADGKATIAATCPAATTFALSMPTADQLEINGKAMVRCAAH